MADILIRNIKEDKEEILVDYDKDSFVENWQENETWEVSFTVCKSDLNSMTFDLIDYENFVLWNSQRFVIKQMASYASGEQVYKDVTATHIYYTIQDCRQYDGSLTGNLTINQVLSHIFKSGNNSFTWEVIDPIGVFSKVEQENFGNGNYLDLINEVIDDYKCVVIPDNKHLRFYPKGAYGKVTEQQIRYKYNTDDVKFDIDTFALKTQIRGSGKKDDNDKYLFSPITYTSSESEKWGIRIQDPVEDERYTIASNMTARLKQELHDYPDISGTVTMKWATSVNKGDKVPFIYEPLNINTTIQVVGMTTYPALPNKPPEITLSNTKKTMTSILASLAKKGVI
ncbi:phage tail protein [Enterococcus dongliensis]|uniref:phage tail protein n=1 Tax=Enterococcus dongliensis TaxID=2559925 RepID=UPI00288D7A1F|nr:phage tail protein [Enterococcus dongliensis]MDT2671773.1 phage tail protein [Enterococcus dongliensis]